MRRLKKAVQIPPVTRIHPVMRNLQGDEIGTSFYLFFDSHGRACYYKSILCLTTHRY